MASSKKKKKVCVVGAGVAGLGAARELLREGHAVTVMEQSDGVGGQWLYDPATDAGDPLGVAGAHSSIYASLRLNTPREAIGFSDFPFYPNKDGTGDARRYPCHGEFLRYIRDFCEAFGLMDAVRLNTKVLRVAMAQPDHDGGNLRWVVTYEGEEVGTMAEEVFDAVVVAVGQYTQPRLPTINGMDKWSRRQLHSHSYRVPDTFKDQVVVIVGSATRAARTSPSTSARWRGRCTSASSPPPAASPPACQRRCPTTTTCTCNPRSIACARTGGWCLPTAPASSPTPSSTARGEQSSAYMLGRTMTAPFTIDHIQHRYDYSFPFLDTAGAITVDDNRVGPLYEHTFPPALAPSLSFVSVTKLVVVPRFFEAQARWVAQVLSGRRSLPPPEEMLRSVEEYHRAREVAGVPKRHTHSIAFDWDYCDEFGDKYCEFPRLEEWKKELIWSSIRSTLDHPESCRDDYHDSDLVLEGLRSKGWLTGRAPATQDGEERAPNPQTHL
ncbi:unnamed protein product [Urochloa decumbens]|uniref:Flavin-containing monooxygenase n=1 Tax=Urochloa decumbens TaxID=240449 RepID=A0ABC9FM03_9POAL